MQPDVSASNITRGWASGWAGRRRFRGRNRYTCFAQVLQRLVHHLDTTSIAEIVVRLVGAEEQTGMYLAPTLVSSDSGLKHIPWKFADGRGIRYG